MLRKTLFTGLALGLIAAMAPAAHAGLFEYVARADDSFAYEIHGAEEISGNKAIVVRLTSQTWQDITWKHWLTIIVPDEVKHTDTALLFITGGNNNDTGPRLGAQEAQILSMTASRTNSIVAMLNQVPNQPLFGGLNEDALIAFTYEKYLQEGGNDWPLLFPMVKSALAAMDAVQSLARSELEQEIERFVLTGGSKRGWTSWLAAVADDRVSAIAPFVIDVLNMEPQMEHMHETYGGYSTMISDYTELDMQNRMDTDDGQVLLHKVDPYAYRDKLDLPKLVVLGTNDPYWTVDAANLYYPGLQGEKYLIYQPNVGHDIGLEGIAATTQFYYNQLNGASFPEVSWENGDGGRLTVTWEGDNGRALLWRAHSPNRDFRKAQWSSEPIAGNGKAEVALDAPEDGWTAYYVEVKFPGQFGMDYGLCTQMVVLPEAYPTEGRTYEAQAGADAGAPTALSRAQN